MGSLVVVVPEELVEGSGSCAEGEELLNVEAFVIHRTEESFDLAVAFRGVGTKEAMSDTQGLEGLLEATAASRVGCFVHGEDPSVIGHDGLNRVGQRGEDSLEEGGGGRASLFGGDPGYGFD